MSHEASQSSSARFAREEASVDPFEVGQITERLPAWELFEDGIEPDDEEPVERHERAA